MKLLHFTLAACLLSSVCFADEHVSSSASSVQQQQNDQHLKAAHLAFSKQPLNLNTMSPGVLLDSVSPYQVMAGTVVPGVLVTGLNSDLPGTVIGQVSQNG